MADGAGYGCRGQSKHENRKVSVSRQQLSRDKVFPIFCLRIFFGIYFSFSNGSSVTHIEFGSHHNNRSIINMYQGLEYSAR